MAPLCDDSGRVSHLSVSAIDITACKEAEKALRRRAEEVEGLPEMESLAGARDIIDRQSRQLVRLVDDLLDVNRIGRGKLELPRHRHAQARRSCRLPAYPGAALGPGDPDHRLDRLGGGPRSPPNGGGRFRRPSGEACRRRDPFAGKAMEFERRFRCH